MLLRILLFPLTLSLKVLWFTCWLLFGFIRRLMFIGNDY